MQKTKTVVYSSVRRERRGEPGIWLVGTYIPTYPLCDCFLSVVVCMKCNVTQVLALSLCQSLGQLGQVVHVSPNNNVKVIMKGQKWIVHPDTLEPAPGRTPPEYTAGN